MAKKALVHCRICKREIDRDNQQDWVMPAEKWFYHVDCYNDFAKKRGRIQEGDIEVEAHDDWWRNSVWEYMRKDLKADIVWQKFSSQWENFLKKGFTGKGMYFSIRYYYEIRKGDIKKCEQGIGIIPHVYEEGTNYWGNRNQHDKGICERIEAQIRQAQEREKKVVQQKRIRNKTKVIDIAAIADTEDEDD